MNPLASLSDYELFVYTLQQKYPIIQQATLVVVRRGATIAVVNGDIQFTQGLRLLVREQLAFDAEPGSIQKYSYELRQNDKVLYWYDSQPHPNNPKLASTHPHHKHIPPDIKHNRVPAPNMRFDQPNLPALIDEIEALLAD